MKHIMPVYEFFNNLYDEPELKEWVVDVLKNFGYKIEEPKHIGDGGNGDVYATTDPTKILKVTKDRVEAANAQYLISLNKPLKRFAIYNKVKEIHFEDNNDAKLQRKGAPAPIYAMIMETLKILKRDSIDGKIVSKLVDNYYICDHKVLGEKMSTYCNFNMESMETFLQRNTEERLVEVFSKDNEVASNMDKIKQYYIAMNELMKEAKENKIVMGDIGVDNFGFNTKNKLVTFDLGGNKANMINENLLNGLDIIKIPSLKKAEKVNESKITGRISINKYSDFIKNLFL